MTATDPTELRRGVVHTALDRLWEYRNAPPRAMDPAGRAMDRMRAEVARYGWALAHVLRVLEETNPGLVRDLAVEIAAGFDKDFAALLIGHGRALGVIDADGATIHRSGS